MFIHVSEFFQSAQGNVNKIKVKMTDKEAELNHVAHESENVSDETISNLESSDKEINLFSKGKERKSKKGRKDRKSPWKESAIDGLVDYICFTEKKLIFNN